MTEAVRALDIEIRVGLHTGEVELVGDDVAGIAVHIAARSSPRSRELALRRIDPASTTVVLAPLSAG